MPVQQRHRPAGTAVADPQHRLADINKIKREPHLATLDLVMPSQTAHPASPRTT
jgi:hypothetical protein